MIMQTDSASHAASEACVYACTRVRTCVCVCSTHTSDCRRKGQQPDMVIMFVPCPTHQPVPVSVPDAASSEPPPRGRLLGSYRRSSHIPSRSQKAQRSHGAGSGTGPSLHLLAAATRFPALSQRRDKTSVISFFTQLRPLLLLPPVFSAWWEWATQRNKRVGQPWEGKEGQTNGATIILKRESEAPDKRGQERRSLGREEPGVCPCDQ